MVLRIWLAFTFLIFVVAKASGQNNISLAFLGVTDKSGYAGAVFKNQVGDAILSALNGTNVFSVRDAREKIELPADNQTIAKVAEELKTYGAVHAKVQSLTVIKPKRDPIVKIVLEAELIPLKVPQVAFKVKAEGKGDDPAEGKALTKAIEKAASEIAQQLSEIVALKGQVLLPPTYSIIPATHYKDRDQIYGRTVRISLDMKSGIKVGSEIAILQGDKMIAEGEIVEVDIGSSLVALRRVMPGTQIRIGDEVRIISIPYHARKLPLPIQKEREYKRVEHDFGWALFIAGIAIGLIGE